MHYDFWNFDSTFAARLALIDETGKSVTYGELSELADAWSAQINAVAQDGRVMLALDFESDIGSIAAYIGALRSGHPLLVVEKGQLSPDSRMQQIWQPDIHLKAGSKDLELVVNKRGNQSPDVPQPHPDLKLLLSTSGTTGDPKLVRLSEVNIGSNAESIAEYLGIESIDRAACTLPFYYSYGLSVLNSYLMRGASLALISKSVNEPAFPETCRKLGVTSLALVPHQFDLLRQAGSEALDIPSLRYITQAGGKLDPDSVQYFYEQGKKQGWDLVIMYGQTEASPRISYVPPEALPAASGTIGRAIPGGKLWLLNEDGSEISAPGRPGELVYEGPNVMMGYAVARPDLALPDETDRLRTGDIAELTEDGLFRIVGRLKRFVKLFGLRISLDQIETLLRNEGIVAQAVSVDDRLVLLHMDENQGEAARTAICDEYKLPSSALYTGHLKEMPLLSSGKPDHKALRVLAQDVIRDEDLARSKQKVSIADALAIATRSNKVQPTDSFTSLGGDSLGYLRVQLALEEAMGRAPTGWENMPLAELESMARSGNSPMGRPGWGSVGFSVILRLFAIGLVVAQHASDYPLYGGTWILILVMGYSAGRFQLRQISEGHVFTLLRKMSYPIIPLYFLILVVYHFFRDPVEWERFSLVGNYFVPFEGSFLGALWFVSLYVQLVLVLMLMASMPAVRSALVKAQWLTVFLFMAAVLLIEAIAINFNPIYDLQSGIYNLTVNDFPVTHIPRRGFLECLPIFLMGWALLVAKGYLQKVATLIAGVVTVVLFMQLDGDNMPALWLGVTILGMMVWGQREIQLPGLLATWLKHLAAATLFVYLTHQAVVHVLRYETGFSDTYGQLATVIVALIGAFALGLVLKWAFDYAYEMIQKVDNTFGFTAVVGRLKSAKANQS